MFSELTGQQQLSLAGHLELLAQDIAIPPSRYEDAANKYEAVGEWLASSGESSLRSARIFVQGSIRLGTAVRPLSGDEFDVDSVVEVVETSAALTPLALKSLVGDRLRESGTYRKMLEEKNRCWRLNYADSSHLHLDILPAIPDGGTQASLRIPDKELRAWKSTNPEAYAAWFTDLGDSAPKVYEFAEMAKADIDPLPQQIPITDLLRRTVQLAKRHRDLFFQDQKQELKPISMILTTLIARAHEVGHSNDATSQAAYVDFLLRSFVDYVEKRMVARGPEYWVTNPTEGSENFAEKWNTHPERREAFYGWHKRLVDDLNTLAKARGEELYKAVGASFGEGSAGRLHERVLARYTAARRAGMLTAAVSGLGTGKGPPVRRNTFYGRDRE